MESIIIGLIRLSPLLEKIIGGIMAITLIAAWTVFGTVLIYIVWRNIKDYNLNKL